MNIRHLGRFSLELSKQFKLTEQEQAIYGVNVSSKNKGTLSTLEHWQSNLRKIQSLGAIDIEELDILPNTPAIFYQLQGSSKTTVSLSAQVENGDSILTAMLQGKENQKENILKLGRNVLNAYRHGDNFGFHVGSGVLLSPPGINEYATATYVDNTRNIELKFHISTAGEKLSENPLSYIEEDINLLKDEGINLVVLQNKPLNLININGTESKIALSKKDDETILNYIWFSAGETGDPLKPEITIEASLLEKDSNLFEEQWNNILKSLHFREPKDSII